MAVVQVKATNGDTFLGGEDFDNTILNSLVGAGGGAASQPLSTTWRVAAGWPASTLLQRVWM
jgi:hypothetical protein